MKLVAAALGLAVAIGGRPVVTRIDCSRPTAADVPLGWHSGAVAFSRTRARGPQMLFLARPGRPGLVRLRVPHVGFETAWSSDERSLSVTWGTFFKTTDVLAADGSFRFRLGNARDATWSPDGRRLAYVRAFRFGDPPDAIHVVNADGSGDRTLADGEAPSWSPDGRRLAFADGGRIWTIEVAGGRRAQVAEPGRPVNGLLLADPGWSPRGDEIAYRAERNGVSELLAVRPNGSGGRRITAADVEDFTWSPDGRRLAVSLPRRLGIVAARGGRLRLLRRDGLAKSRPHWSQDGRRLAYAASGGGSSEVWLADTRTLDEHQLTAHCQIARPR